jgi:hypothetical protein
MRRTAIAVWTVLVVAILAGCARPGTGPGDGSAENWTTYQADVTNVRRGPEARSVLLDVAVLAGQDGCSRDPRITYYTEEYGRIFANVVQDSRRSHIVGACPSTAPAVVTLTAPEPIGDRILVLNQEAWAPSGAAYRRCDPQLGCTPPADPCDRVWVQAAVMGMDVSRHSVGSVEGCDGTWLVMTVPSDPVPCGAEPRPGCTAIVNVRRYFLRFVVGKGWQTIAASTAAGCGDVSSVEPAFPTRLCASLPRP